MTISCIDACLNGGLCSINNTCVCTECFIGRSCEINVNARENSLMALMFFDIQQAETIDDFNWPKFSYIFIITFLLVLSLINNIFSLQIFMKYEIRQTNYGIYQILFSCGSMIAVIAMHLRMMTTLWFDYLINAYIYQYIACDILPVIDKVMSTFSMCIATLLPIEFVLLECFNLKLHRSRWLSVILSIILFLAAFSLRINVFIYRRPSPNPYRSNSYICKYIHPLQFESLDKVYFIFQIVIPVTIHCITCLCIFISITKRISFIFNRHDSIRIFLEECFRQKHFFIRAFFIVLSNTPLLILHLKDGCEDIQHLSILRRHAAFSILTYLPESMTFFIYIYPSPSYMPYFKKTLLGKLLKKIFNSCRRKEKDGDTSIGI